MRRFYIPHDQCKGTHISLSGREAHHAVHVLRVALHEKLIVMDGAGGKLECEVVHAARHQLDLKVVTRHQVAPSPCQITLLQAVPKGKLIEDIIEKSTELGVHRVVPLLTDRVVVHLHPESKDTKISRWQTAAVEAIKQCGQPWLPQIEAPVTLPAFLQTGESFDLSFIASLTEDPLHPRQVIEKYVAAHGRLPRTVAVWIGPEGDFTPEETAMVRQAGAIPISLGPWVLRCETAAICSLAVVGYEIRAAGAQG